MLLLTILVLFSPLITAWSVAFYNDNTSAHEASYYSYSGTGIGDCLLVGSSSDNCTYAIGGGATNLACYDEQLILAADFGMNFPAGTSCFMGYDSRCSVKPLFEKQECVMAPAGAPEGFKGTQIWFQCSGD